MRKEQAIWVVLATSMSFYSASAAEIERVLVFPSDRAVGRVQSRPKTEDGFRYDENWYEGWQDLGPAQGEIKIPADHFVQLSVGKAGSSDLSFLEKLDPESIDALILRDTDVTDEGLRFVSRLASLQFLDLQQTKITDACAPHFANLKELVRIDLGAFDVHEDGFGVGDKVLGVLGTLPKLDNIGLRLTKVTDAGMAELAKCQSLQSVSVPGTVVSDAGLVHLAKLKNLKSLSLGVYDEGAKITDEGLKTVGQMPGLRWLGLSGTPITDAGLPYLSGLKNLESLNLDETKVTSAGLAHLEPLQSILRLRLMDTVDDECAKHLAKLKNLQSISSNLDVSDEGVAYLASMPNLEELMLSDEKVTDASLPAIAKMPKLKTLWFQHCKVTDEGIAKLAGHPTLEYVLFYVDGITTKSLATFVTWPKLNNLNFEVRRENDPDPDWSKLAEFTQVDMLDVGGTAFTPKDVKYIAGLTQLKRLDIQPQVPLNDEAVAHIAGLANLESLHLHSTVVTDQGMQALANKSKVDYMSISCQATDEGLKALYGYKSLQLLSIASPYITEKGLKSLTEALPSLREINRYNYSLNGMDVSASSKDDFLRKGEIDTRSDKDKLEDTPAPQLNVSKWYNQDEPDLKLADLEGKVILVFFWDASDSKGIEYLPKLKQLMDDNDELAILAIHGTEGAENAEMYVSPLLMPWPIGIDDADKTKSAWKVDSYPSFYLVDRQGKLRFADIYPEHLEPAVKLLVEEVGTSGRSR
jgi:internalin A